MLNLVCRDDDLREKTVSSLGGVFSSVASYKVPLEVNEVLYCGKDEATLKGTGKSKSKKKVDLSCPVVVAYKAVNEEVRDEDFIAITESVKNLQIMH